jgi:exosortase
VDMAQVPQEWAAFMTEKFMLLLGYSVTRDGNTLQVLPGPDGTLAVAEKCSGLKMLFAFVALSVVYAYISKRPVWRRVVIFVSSFPIAILANFARVIAMALATKWGYRQIAQEGLQHMLTGFLVMLPLAFFLLYLEMRLLDAIEWLADIIVGEEPPEDSAPGSAADAPTDGV